jgi:hypothetical protein
MVVGWLAVGCGSLVAVGSVVGGAVPGVRFFFFHEFVEEKWRGITMTPLQAIT